MVEFRTVAIVLVVLVVLGGLLIAKPGILSSQEDIAGKAANFLNSQSFRYHDVKHLGDLFLFFGQLTSNDFSFVNFAF